MLVLGLAEALPWLERETPNEWYLCHAQALLRAGHRTEVADSCSIDGRLVDRSPALNDDGPRCAGQQTEQPVSELARDSEHTMCLVCYVQ